MYFCVSSSWLLISFTYLVMAPLVPTCGGFHLLDKYRGPGHQTKKKKKKNTPPVRAGQIKGLNVSVLCQSHDGCGLQ